MRIKPEGDGTRIRNPQEDSRLLNCRIFARRESFALLTWGPKPGNAQSRIRAKLNARVAPAPLDPNSSRGVTPGLIDPNGPDTPANRVRLPFEAKRKPRRRKAPATLGLISDDDDDNAEANTPQPQSPPPATSTSKNRRPPLDPRSETAIKAHRLLIVGTKGKRALEPGASTNYEDWSASNSSDGEETL